MRERAELGPDVVVGDGAVVRDARLERALVSPGVTLVADEAQML